ncbi:50S ribosomal protein L36 [Micromonospora qiuiae]|nr:50S ribosomal protein L36 [Micromonospora qiuiae]
MRALTRKMNSVVARRRGKVFVINKKDPRQGGTAGLTFAR